MATEEAEPCLLDQILGHSLTAVLIDVDVSVPILGEIAKGFEGGTVNGRLAQVDEVGTQSAHRVLGDRGENVGGGKSDQVVA